jgi:rhodanese-related sulfurtransferase
MKNVTVQELKEKMDRGDNFILLDVREPHEYEEANLGGKLFPLNRIQTMQTEELDEHKDDEIIIHCKSGHRSMMACMLLEQMGFSNTANVTGGILAWKEKFGSAK